LLTICIIYTLTAMFNCDEISGLIFMAHSIWRVIHVQLLKIDAVFDTSEALKFTDLLLM